MAGRFGLLTAVPVLAFALVSSIGSGAQAASSTNSPRLALSEVAPASVLHGNHATIQLQASDPGPTPLTALAIRALLPAGVDYRAGSTSPATAGEPQITHDASGRTALVWSDLADLGTGSSVPLSFQVDPEVAPSVNAIATGTSFTIDSSAYASTDAAAKPQFDPLTGTAKAGVVGATASGSTTISVLSVTVTSPSADGRMLRGVHDHQGLFTVSVANNGVAPTKNVVLDGYLSAALEFIGCGNVDNGRVEYQYAQTLAGRAGTPAGCRPKLGETAALKTDALGAALPSSSAWTHVQWSVGDLAPGDTQTVSFLAGVPLRANVPFGSNAPSPQSLRQLANLDNNTGPQTDQAGAQTVLFEARGANPAGTVVGASGSTSVTPVDIAVVKSVDQAAFVAGQQVVETITLHTSEYVDARQVAVNDLLPSGIGPGLTAPTPQYATPPAENADGTSTLSFLLDHIAPNGTATITVPLRDLARYRANSADTTLVAAGDTFADALTVTSTGTTLRCASPDGLCAKGAVQGIDGSAISTTIGLASGDSSTLQSAPQTVVTSSVSERPAPGTALDCSKATYVPAASSPFVRNDVACLRLHVAVPAGVPARSAVLTASIPSGLSVSAADIASGPQAVQATALTHRAAGDMAWALGATDPQDSSETLYAAPGSTFDVTLPVRFTRDPASPNADDALLSTFRLASSTHGGSGSLQRSAVALSLTQPRLSVRTAITSIDSAGHLRQLSGAPQAAGALPGDRLTVAVTVTNAGGVTATATELWAQLPDGVDCAAVSATSDRGRCTGGIVRWDVPGGAALTVPAASSRTVTFALTAPADMHAVKVLSATAAVRSFSTQADTGAANAYAPTANVDPAMAQSRDTPAQSNMSSATVVSADPTLTASVSATSPSPYTQGGTGETFTANVNAKSPGGVPNATGATDRVVILPSVGAGLTVTKPTSPGAPWTCYDPDLTNHVNAGLHCSNDSNEPTTAHPATSNITPLNVGSDSGPGTNTTLTFPVTVAYGSTTTSTVDFALTSTDTVNDTVVGTTSPHSVTIVRPQLTLSLGHTPPNPALGGDLTVQATLANATAAPTDPATDITVVDDLPADYTYNAGFTPVTVPAAAGTQTYGCTTATVSGHIRVTCTLHGYSIAASPVVAEFGATLPTAPTTYNPESNSASASGGASSTSPSGVTDSIAPAAPNVQMNQTVSPTPFREGVPSVFTITIQNTGTAASSALMFKDTLGDADANASFTPAVSSSPVTVTCTASAAATAKCDVPALPAGSAAVTITVTPTTSVGPPHGLTLSDPPAANDIKNTISLADALPAPTPLDPITTTNAVTTVPVATVNLKVEVTNSPTVFGLGGSGTVSVKVTNVASNPDPYTGDVHVAIDLNHTTTGLTRTAITAPSPWTCTAGDVFTCDAPAASVSMAGGASLPQIDITVDIATTASNHVKVQAVVTAPNDYDLGAGPTTALDTITTRGANITGVVYEDVNANGTFDSGTDKGLGGLLVHLTGGASDVTTCGGSGPACPAGKPTGYFSIGGDSLLPSTPYTLSVDLCTAGGGHGACASAHYATGNAGGTVTPANAVSVTPPAVRTVAALSILKADAGKDVGGYNLGEVRSAQVTVNVFKDDVDNKGLHPGFGGGNPSDSGTVDLSGSQVELTFFSSPLFATVPFTQNPVVASSQTGAGGTVTFSFNSLVGTSFVYPGTYTVTVHQNGGLLLGHFTYLDADGTTVRTQLPTSRSAITLVILALPVADDSTANPQFGELDPATLEGLSFRDKGDTGVYDSTNDATIPTKITLTGSDDLSATLGDPPSVDNLSLATFDFTNLRPGTYTLTATVPTLGCPGATACLVGIHNDITLAPIGTDNLATAGDNPPDLVSNITIKAGQDGKNYNFAFIDPHTVSGFVYEDANDDGCFSLSGLTCPPGGANDTAVPGATVHIQGVDDRGVTNDYTGTTNATGLYTITPVRPSHFFATVSTYTMTLSPVPTGFLDGKDSVGVAKDELLNTVPTGATSTHSVPNTISSLTLGAPTGLTATQFNFGLLRPNTISGFVYNDTEDKGCYASDIGLPGPPVPCVGGSTTPLNGVVVTLTGHDDFGNPVTATTSSAPNGAYSFTGLRPGIYDVAQQPTPGMLVGKNSVGAAGITSNLLTQLGFAGTADLSGAPDYTVDSAGNPSYLNSTTQPTPPPNGLHGLCLFVTTLITPTTSNSNVCLTPQATGAGCAQQCEGATAAHNDLAEVGESSIDATVWQDPCESDVGKPASTILDEFSRDPTACFPQVPGTRLSAINLLLTQIAADGNAPMIDATTLTTGASGRVTFLHLYPGQYKLAIKSDDGYRDGPMIPLKTGPPDDILNGVTADPAAPPVPVQFPETVFSKIVLTPDSHTSAGQSDPTGLLIARRPPSASLVTTVTHTGDFVAGTKGTYSIKVDNNGPSTAQGPIVVIDSLPPGMTFDSFNDPSNQWLCTPLAADVLCTFPGQLSNPGQTPQFNLTVDVSPDQPQGAVNNQVVATSATKDVLGNNRTTDSTNVVLSSDLAMHADLSGLFGQNGVAVYVMSVTNNGPSTSPAQATVTDPFPRELTPVQFAGDWQCYGAGQTVTCYSNNPIEPGTSRALALFALVGVPNGTTVTNSSRVDGLTNDPNPANNSDGIAAVVGVTVGTASINGPLPQLPTSGVPDIGGPNTGAGQHRWTQALLLVGLGSVLVAAAVLVPGRRRRSGKNRA